MRYSSLCCLALVAFAGCRGGDSTAPRAAGPGSTSFLIVDGAHNTGNPDFFFLPPMAADPSGKPEYDAGAFNPNLRPTVTICALDPVGIPPVTATTLCKSHGYTQTATVSAQDDQYHYNWSVPISSDVFYRIKVTVGTKLLGFADVQTAASQAALKSVDASQFVAAKSGTTLPVKFRVEKNALCTVPSSPCVSQTIDFSTGGTVTTQLEGGTAGVTIPAQTNTVTSTITVESCLPLNPRVTDLPVFGPCLHIAANPALSASDLANAATVSICAVSAASTGLTLAQNELITLHRFDEGTPSKLAALPHAPACLPSLVSASIKGLFQDLAHGAFKSAGAQLVSLMLPKPLYAATRRLDVGAGGFSLDFSDFQFALPAKLKIVDGNGQVAAPGSVLPIQPTVIVTDLLGAPVLGARVHFASDASSCALLALLGDQDPTAVVSSLPSSLPIGEVSTPWTISITPGANTLAACGRGLAGTDFNGPRTGVNGDVVDPFQPLSTHFLDPSNGPFVPVLTGSVLFTATGTVLPSTPIEFGSGGYSSYGPLDSTAAPPPGWPSPSPASSLAIGSQSPFGGNYSGCPLTNSFGVTPTFPVNKDIFVTKRFITPTPGNLEVTILIDNDLRIWIDGDEKTSSVPASPPYGAYDGVRFWRHDYCAHLGPAVYTIWVGAGIHTISLLGHDRGSVGYLDMQVLLKP